MAGLVWRADADAHANPSAYANAKSQSASELPPGFEVAPGFERVTLATGPESGGPVILLHELPGMTPDDMALALKLGEAGFRVYMPLLFGEIGQDRFLAGYWQACVRGEFVCSTRSTSSPVLAWLGRSVDKIAADTKRPVGIIGMCLTGIMPVALMRAAVSAAVACQPTVPFNPLFGRPTGEQKSDLGLAAVELARAQQASVPVLTMHYAETRSARRRAWRRCRLRCPAAWPRSPFQGTGIPCLRAASTRRRTPTPCRFSVRGWAAATRRRP
jgi:dienelactone hydrolase